MFLRVARSSGWREEGMKPVRQTVAALPFVIAGILNAVVIANDFLKVRREPIAGLCFLFATPWGWLLDRGWLGSVHNRTAFFAVLLWLPAVLYSVCLRFILLAVEFAISRVK